MIVYLLYYDTNMQRPELNKTDLSGSLKYWVSPTSQSIWYQATISDWEEKAIRDWVDNKYWWYNQAYRDAAYKDAYTAVLNRKTDIEKQEIKSRERKERAEIASYSWEDQTKKMQKQLAQAQNAISDAADLIRRWQEQSWIRTDKSLTDKEMVDAFLKVNQWKPYWEYVSAFLNSQIWWWWMYDNMWLANKLWLAEDKYYDIRDKAVAWTKWFLQWTANLAQNTIWRASEWAGSNLADWIWEWLYWTADLLWADVSEWTIWDKMKKAKWYTWDEAKEAASSKDLFQKWILSEDMWAYWIWEDIWEVATEVALTAPLWMWWATAIAKSTLPTAEKWLLTAWEAFWEWLVFQWLDDLTEWEMSKMREYLTTWTLSALTAWLFNWIGKLLWKTWVISKWTTKLFWAKWQTETALNKTWKLKWQKITELSERWSKNKNIKETPYTYIADKLNDAKQELLNTRISAWQNLQKTRSFDLKYWPSKYTSEDIVKKDLNDALNTLTDVEKFWDLAAKQERIPKFDIVDWEITISNPELLNNIARADEKKWTVKLYDEIKQARDETYSLWAEINEATTNKFLWKLEKILDKSRWWWDDLVKIMQDWIKNARSNFNNSLTKKSLKNLEKVTKEDRLAIMMDKSFDDYVWAIRRWDLEWITAAQKAIWWDEAQAELFRLINKEYWIDLNNEILMVAYNMSLYDARKAMEFLQRIYPSKPWMLEAWLQFLTKNARIKAASKQLRWNNVLKMKNIKSWAKEAWQVTEEAIEWIAEE